MIAASFKDLTNIVSMKKNSHRKKEVTRCCGKKESNCAWFKQVKMNSKTVFVRELICVDVMLISISNKADSKKNQGLAHSELDVGFSHQSSSCHPLYSD